jgi:hypothetical protein
VGRRNLIRQPLHGDEIDVTALALARGAFLGASPVHKTVIVLQQRRNVAPVPCPATMQAENLETTFPAATGPRSRLNILRPLGIGAHLARGLVTAALIFPFASPDVRLAFARRSGWMRLARGGGKKSHFSWHRSCSYWAVRKQTVDVGTGPANQERSCLPSNTSEEQPTGKGDCNEHT